MDEIKTHHQQRGKEKLNLAITQICHHPLQPRQDLGELILKPNIESNEAFNRNNQQNLFIFLKKGFEKGFDLILI